MSTISSDNSEVITKHNNPDSVVRGSNALVKGSIIPNSWKVSIVFSMAITFALAVCVILAVTGHFPLLSSHPVFLIGSEIITGISGTVQLVSLGILGIYYCKEKSNRKIGPLVDEAEKLGNKSDYGEYNLLNNGSKGKNARTEDHVPEEGDISMTDKWWKSLQETPNCAEDLLGAKKIYNLNDKKAIPLWNTGHYKVPYLGNYGKNEFGYNSLELAVKLPKSQKEVFPAEMQKMCGKQTEIENYFIVFRNKDKKIKDENSCLKQIFMHPYLFELDADFLHGMDDSAGEKIEMNMRICNLKGLNTYKDGKSTLASNYRFKKDSKTQYVLPLQLNKVNKRSCIVHGNYFSPEGPEIDIDTSEPVSSFSMGVTYRPSKKEKEKAIFFHALILNDENEGDGKILSKALEQRNLGDFLEKISQADNSFSDYYFIWNLLVPKTETVYSDGESSEKESSEVEDKKGKGKDSDYSDSD